MTKKKMELDKENIPPSSSSFPEDELSGAFNGLLLRTKVKARRHSKTEASVSAKLSEWSNRYTKLDKPPLVAKPPPTFAAMPHSPEVDDYPQPAHGWSCSLCRRTNSLREDKCALCCSTRRTAASSPTTTTTKNTPNKTTNTFNATPVSAKRWSPLPAAIHEKQA